LKASIQRSLSREEEEEIVDAHKCTLRREKEDHKGKNEIFIFLI